MLKSIINKVPTRGVVDQQQPASIVSGFETRPEVQSLELLKEVKMLRTRFPFNKLPTPFNTLVGFLLVGTIFLGACIYYDRMRHRDPDFPKKLKEQRKRNATKHHHHHQKNDGSGQNILRDSGMQISPLQSKRLTVTIPTQKYEDILINEICIAETYMKQQNTEQALIHFATAIAMSYDPSQIIASLRRTLPPMMYNDLAFVLNERYANKFSFMYEDRQMIPGRIHVPAPQHSVLYH